MKNIITLIIALFTISSISFAQTKGQIIYDAYSGRTSVANPANDNGYPYEYEIETGYLYFKDGISLYQQKQNEMVTVIRTDADGVSKSEIPRNNRDETGWIYLTDLNKKIITSRESYWNLSSFEAMDEPIQKIDWVITGEVKKIAGYSCTKAIGSIYGRQWEVYFTDKIPVAFGPWKLGGLPGLILEAQNKDLDFIYTIKEIKIPAQYPNSVFDSNYFGSKKLSKDEFVKKNQKKKQKYLSYMESVAVENDGSVNIKFYPTRELNENEINK